MQVRLLRHKNGADMSPLMTLPNALPEALAAAVVARALELLDSDADNANLTVRNDDALLATPSVQALLAQTPGPHDPDPWNRIMTRLAISLARKVVSIWTDAHPDCAEPLRAVEAAEAWAACPCKLHADAAAETMAAAAHQAMATWRVPPKEAAWAARTAAWTADAPKYGWQTVAAIGGACHATSADDITAAAARFFAAEFRTR